LKGFSIHTSEQSLNKWKAYEKPIQQVLGVCESKRKTIL
jgi:hypothetical protein